jgi:peptidyl-prolyl cis-trans isomerase D
MLEAIRNKAGSFVVKILFLVLVLSFVLWGIADVFSPSQGPDWVAEVGDTTVSTDDFRDAYGQAMRQHRATFGQTISPEQARALGLPEAVLNQMITRTLLDLAARDLGLVVPDEVVREAITRDPTFRDAVDRFDPERFREVLSLSGISEGRYVSLLRSDIARSQLVESVTAVPAVPDASADLLYRYDNERRVGRYVLLPFGAIEDVSPPDDAALRAYYEENQARFTRPEYRTLTAIVLEAAELAQTVAVDDEDLRAAYEERIERYTRPPRRSFRQMVFDDPETAAQAVRRLREGARFEALAEELTGEGARETAVDEVAFDELPADLAQAVFALEPGGIAEPVRSPLGWHVVRLTGTSAETVRPLEEVAGELRREIAEERSVERLIEVGNRLDDILGGGGTLEQAAAEIGLAVRSVPAVDADGFDPAGQAVPELPAGLVDTAFETAPGEQSLLQESQDDTYFVLRVDALTPPAVQPFEEVRDEVLALVRAERRVSRSRERAEALAAQIDEGRDFATVVADTGLDPQTTEPLTRAAAQQPQGPGAGEQPPPAFVDALFSTPEGKGFVTGASDGFYVGEVVRVEPANPASDPEGAAAVRETLRAAIEQDLLQQYVAALRARYPVQINTEALYSSF